MRLPDIPIIPISLHLLARKNRIMAPMSSTYAETVQNIVSPLGDELSASEPIFALHLTTSITTSVMILILFTLLSLNYVGVEQLLSFGVKTIGRLIPRFWIAYASHEQEQEHVNGSGEPESSTCDPEEENNDTDQA
ncbi:hypothetical protein QCA50_006516 [Cerrena zonata]|uniref:Uncharacterized protein n=1 Tax=Cerrena zonata TaxID=2478898 RepID=A0AAW0GJ15_9APHY